VVYTNVAGDGVKPWKYRLARAIGVAHFVDAQPGFLQEIIGVGAADKLRDEKAMQLRTDAMNEERSGGEIAALVTGHQQFQIAVHVHKRRSGRILLISPGAFLQMFLGER